MAVNAFLKIDGIEGPSTNKFHKGEFEILSWGWGVAQATSPTGGAGSGKPQATPLSFNMLPSSASVPLVASVCTGETFKSAIFTAEEGNPTQKGTKTNSYIKYVMTDVFVTSYQLGGAEGALPTESISLVFKKLELEYKDQKGEERASTCDFEWDVKEK
jgi:type VI protein secretion system component Hcp